MKLKLILTTLALSSALLAKAQARDYNPKYSIDVKTGFTITCADGFGDFSIFPLAEITGDIHVSPLPFYIETGIEYMKRQHWGYDNHSFVIPAIISYRIALPKNLTLVPFFGPYLSYGFNSNEVDDGIRLGAGIRRGKYSATLGYDISTTYGDDDDALFLTIGYNIWKK